MACLHALDYTGADFTHAAAGQALKAILTVVQCSLLALEAEVAWDAFAFTAAIGGDTTVFIPLTCDTNVLSIIVLHTLLDLRIGIQKIKTILGATRTNLS